MPNAAETFCYALTDKVGLRQTLPNRKMAWHRIPLVSGEWVPSWGSLIGHPFPIHIIGAAPLMRSVPSMSYVWAPVVGCRHGRGLNAKALSPFASP